MTKIFAHRGYCARYPENTMLSFKKAMESGCDGIELDVQLSKDGQLVIIHDEDIRRTTNGSGAVCDMTHAEMRAFDAGHGERIPLLSEYFDLVCDSPLITNVELKNNVLTYDGMEEKVLELVYSRGLSNRVIISSFNHLSVNKVKRLAPNMPCGYICTGTIDGEAIWAAMRENGVEFLHPRLRSLSEAVLGDVKKYNIPISVWTVNNEDDMRGLIEMGVYGVFTNDPALLVSGKSLQKT